MTPAPIVVIGDIAVDILSSLRAMLVRGSDAPAAISITPGGSAANVAVWLARLGHAASFIGRVGDDPFGRWLAADLAGEGVHPVLVVDPTRKTGVIQVLVEPGGERTMVPDRGANAVWSTSDVPEAIIAGARLVHVVGYVLLDRASRAGALAAMAMARQHRVPVSLDPSSHAPLRGLGTEAFWPMIGRPDVLLPNRQEAEALTGATQPEAQLAALAGRAETVVIKLDRDGCIAQDAGGAVHWAAAPRTPIVNATGAGDAFNAAFLAAWLNDRDLAAATRAAVALGTFAATLAGTR